MSEDAAAARIIGTLEGRGETLSAAESCTGGGILAALTSVPGSSAVVWGGVVAYANDAKTSLLGVDPRIIEGEGAVSSAAARAMAWGMKARSGSDWAVAVTGIAGPGGGSEDKPVGTVWIAWTGPGLPPEAERFLFDGDREAVRRSAAARALEGLDSRVTRRSALDRDANGLL